MEHYFIESPKSMDRYKILKTNIRGFNLTFYTSSSVFSTEKVDDGTKLLAESMIIPENSTILDLGCGYGVLGIIAAKLCSTCKVYMIDINRRAIELAKLNVKVNGVENQVVILQGDSYQPVKDLKFDVIVTNPPYTAGEDIVKKWIIESKKHLNKRGSFQMVVPKKFSKKYQKIIEQVYESIFVIGESNKYVCYMGVKR